MISSRTPGGRPNRCPICDTSILVEPSDPPGDAPCPSCGALLWFTKTPEGLWFFGEGALGPIRQRIFEIICDTMGVDKDRLTYDFSFEHDFESLDQAEMVMEVEEEFHFRIPDRDAEKIKTIRDLIDYILRRKHGDESR